MTATATHAGPVVRRHDDIVPISWSGGEQGRFFLTAEDTGGTFSYYEVLVPPGEGTVIHRHDEMDETFHVISGEFEIVVADRVVLADAGTVVFGPRGVFHSFRNTGAEEGVLHCVTNPGGIERFFTGLSELLHADPPAEWSRMSALAVEHGIVAAPPGSTAAQAHELAAAMLTPEKRTPMSEADEASVTR